MTKPRVEFSYPTEPFGRIPAFNSIEEEAAFWDTHDVSEFIGTEFQPTEDQNAAEQTDRLIIHLDHAEREALSRRAREEGLSPAVLVRLWIEERLKREAG